VSLGKYSYIELRLDTQSSQQVDQLSQKEMKTAKYGNVELVLLE
jgi:hypothetical protein